MIAALFAMALAPVWQPVEISVYARSYHRKKTASGSIYDHYTGLTAARSESDPGVPFGSRWIIRYGGRSVTVTITDTGPYRPKGKARWFDLSGAAWKALTNNAKPTRIYTATARRVQ